MQTPFLSQAVSAHYASWILIQLLFYRDSSHYARLFMPFISNCGDIYIEITFLIQVGQTK